MPQNHANKTLGELLNAAESEAREAIRRIQNTIIENAVRDAASIEKKGKEKVTIYPDPSGLNKAIYVTQDEKAILDIIENIPKGKSSFTSALAKIDNYMFPIKVILAESEAKVAIQAIQSNIIRDVAKNPEQNEERVVIREKNAAGTLETKSIIYINKEARKNLDIIKDAYEGKSSFVTALEKINSTSITPEKKKIIKPIAFCKTETRDDILKTLNNFEIEAKKSVKQIQQTIIANNTENPNKVRPIPLKLRDGQQNPTIHVTKNEKRFLDCIEDVNENKCSNTIALGNIRNITDQQLGKQKNYFSLQGLDEIEQGIIEEHKVYLEKKLPSGIKNIKDDTQFFYSPLESLGLRSDVKRAEINDIDKIKTTFHPESDELKKKDKNTTNKDIADIKSFAKEYKKYYVLLQERFLFKSIRKTVANVVDQPLDEQDGQLKNDIKKLQSLLSEKGMETINMQTRAAFLIQNQEVITILHRLKKNPKFIKNYEHKQQLEQLEALYGIWFETHDEKVKKRTMDELARDGIASTATGVGLATGVTATALWTMSVTVPVTAPVLSVPAFILSWISLIAYVNTAVRVFELVLKKAHNRKPSAKEIRSVVIDLLIAPLNITGIFIFRFFTFIASKISNIAAYVTNLIARIWNNALSNVTDIPFTKDTISGVKELFKAPTAEFRLRNTRSATAPSALRGLLAQQGKAEDALKAVQNIKRELKADEATTSYSNIARSISSAQSQTNDNDKDKKTAKFGRDFFYVRPPLAKENSANHDLVLDYKKSYHAHILTWNSGHFSLFTSKEAKAIDIAVAAYRSLPPDSTYLGRYQRLMNIKVASSNYLHTKTAAESKRYKYVEKLSNYVIFEIDGLSKLLEAEDFSLHSTNADVTSLSPILVGFKNK